jgi:general stress protein 26
MATMTDPKAAFDEVLAHFDTAMLVTLTPEGEIRARPMALAASQADGDLWFITSIDSPKADEIRNDQHVAATFQSKRRYLSISGRAEIVRDAARIRTLWKDQYRAWFPRGADDPAIALVHLIAVRGEYWDSHGLRGIEYLFDRARARLEGKSAADQPSQQQHGKVQL